MHVYVRCRAHTEPEEERCAEHVRCQTHTGKESFSFCVAEITTHPDFSVKHSRGVMRHMRRSVRALFSSNYNLLPYLPLVYRHLMAPGWREDSGCPDLPRATVVVRVTGLWIDLALFSF